MKIFFNPVTNSQIWEWDQNIYACISTYSMILEWDQNIWAWIWTYSHIWESDHDISIYLGVDIVIYPCDQHMIKYVGVDSDSFSDPRKRSTISCLDVLIYSDRLIDHGFLRLDMLIVCTFPRAVGVIALHSDPHIPVFKYENRFINHHIYRKFGIYK